MLGSLLATNEGVIDFVTNVRTERGIYNIIGMGKTGGIDVRLTQAFFVSKLLGFKLGMELN